MLSKSAIEGFLAELSAPADTSETEIRKEQFKKEKGGGGVCRCAQQEDKTSQGDKQTDKVSTGTSR